MQSNRIETMQRTLVSMLHRKCFGRTTAEDEFGETLQGTQDSRNAIYNNPFPCLAFWGFFANYIHNCYFVLLYFLNSHSSIEVIIRPHGFASILQSK